MISNDEIHVWEASLGLAPGGAPDRLSILSLDERERARQYRFDLHRGRFIAARAFMRSVLGLYLGVDPRSIALTTSKHGKPQLVESRDIFFNLTHSEDCALLAIGRRRVGVDLERIRPMADLLTIAEAFSPHEVDALRSADPEERTRRFYTCWTRKEAYLKAEGRGLARPLSTFTVSHDPAFPELLEVDGDRGVRSQWILIDLDLGHEYAACLAAEAPRPRIVQRRWDETTLACCAT